eukprot:1157540-Pelagomonas_calceolata.AAC.6
MVLHELQQQYNLIEKKATDVDEQESEDSSTRLRGIQMQRDTGRTRLGNVPAGQLYTKQHWENVIHQSSSTAFPC